VVVGPSQDDCGAGIFSSQAFILPTRKKAIPRPAARPFHDPRD
jgi:hypothetical protein